jgi:uncharacterized glyoxalase superfamily protein PhnB
MTHRAPSIYPTLRYDDAHEAIRFFTDAFGFAVQELHEGSDGGVDHALLSYGNSLIVVSSRQEDTAFDHGPYALYVAVEDPDAHHGRATAAGAAVVMSLTDQPYGSREYAARDPEGHLWSFGTYRPAVTSGDREPEVRWMSLLNHLAIQCRDLAASAAFYDQVVAPLGGARVVQYGDTIGYGVGVLPSFWIGPLTTGEPSGEVHIALNADSRQAVREFHRTALALGAESLHEPRLWPEYHQNYYGAFLRDPDGNNLEAVCHYPEGPGLGDL